MSPTTEEKITFELTKQEAEVIRRLLQGRRDYLRSTVVDGPESQPRQDVVESVFSYFNAKLRPRDG